MKTKLVKLRKGSLGLKGSIRNAKHHAQAMLPFIEALREPLKNVGFAVWRRGHNVHVFETDDGRKFTLRPIEDEIGYCGVRLALRLSRSEEVFLMDICDPDECEYLVSIMEALVGPMKGTSRASLCKAA